MDSSGERSFGPDPTEGILKFLAIAVTVVAVAVLLWPFLVNSGMIMKAHDILFQLVFTRQFSSAFLDGQFPIRYVDTYYPGTGVPQFNFYPPGFYYLYLIPKLFGLPNLAAFNFISSLLWLSSGFFMYLFSRKHFGVLGGLTSALLYVFAPYHILQYYVRASMAEFTAISLAPGIFWALNSYWEKQKGRYFFATTIIFGAFSLSHVLTTAIFGPVIVLFQIFLLLKYRSKKIFISSSVSLLFGFLISSFFVLPSIFETKYTQSQGTFTGAGSYHLHFVCPLQIFSNKWDYGPSLPGCEDQMSFQIGVVHWILLIICIGLLINFLIRKGKFEFVHWLLISSGIGLVISIFMMFDISSFVWEKLPYFGYFQFPWRYLTLIIFCTSVVGGGIFLFIKNSVQRLLTYLAIVILVIAFYSGYLHPAYYIPENIINYNNQNFLKGLEKDVGDHEIIHKSVPSGLYYKDVTKVLPKSFIVPASEVEASSGKATFYKTDLKANYKVYGINAQEDSLLRFYTNYFPGWQVYMDGQKTPFSFKNEYGFIDVSVPKGNHEVVLSFEDTPIRVASNLISLFSFFTALFVAFFMEKKMRVKERDFTIA